MTLSKKEKEEVLEKKDSLPKIIVSSEVARDLENIANGVFSPLKGFLKSKDYENVLYEMRLSDDTPWTIPIVLDVSEEKKKELLKSDEALLVSDNKPVAVLKVEEIYDWDKQEYAKQVYGTLSNKHPGVVKTKNMKDYLVGGKVFLVNALEDEFSKFKLKPVETRVLFKERGWREVAGFQTRNVPHLGHEYLQKTALTFVDGVFINPIIGKKKKGDYKDRVILEAYEALIEHYYLKERAVLAIFRTEMRYAGPREAIFHAIVRKNFGCTHFIVGRDHAGVGDFYHPYAAQEIFDEFPDLGIIPIFFRSFHHCDKCGGVVNDKTCPHDEKFHKLFKGRDIRKMLVEGKIPPGEMMRPEVAEIILKEENPFVS